jgi:hypothetical protein
MDLLDAQVSCSCCALVVWRAFSRVPAYMAALVCAPSTPRCRQHAWSESRLSTGGSGARCTGRHGDVIACTANRLRASERSATVDGCAHSYHFLPARNPMIFHTRTLRTLAHSHTRTLAHSHTHTPTHSRTPAHSRTHALTHTRTLTHSRTHAHPHTHALTHTRTPAHSRTAIGHRRQHPGADRGGGGGGGGAGCGGRRGHGHDMPARPEGTATVNPTST